MVLLTLEKPELKFDTSKMYIKWYVVAFESALFNNFTGANIYYTLKLQLFPTKEQFIRTALFTCLGITKDSAPWDREVWK